MRNHQDQELDRIARAASEIDREMQTRGTVDHMRRTAARAVARTSEDCSTAGSIKASVEAEYAHASEAWTGTVWAASRPLVHHFQSAAATWTRVGGDAALVIEGCFTAWLTLAFTTLPPWVACLAGVVVAWSTAFFAKGIATAYLGKFADTPLVARDRLIAAAFVFGFGSVAMLAIVFWARSGVTTALSLVAWMFGIATTLLSLLLPLTAAALFGLSELFSWSTRLATRWERSEATTRRLNRLSEAASVQLEALSNGDDRPSEQLPLFERRPMVFRGMAMILLTFPSPMVQGVDARLDYHVWKDWSASVDSNEMNAASVVLARIVARPGVTVSILPLGDDAWTTTAQGSVAFPFERAATCTPLPRSEFAKMFLSGKNVADSVDRADCSRERDRQKKQFVESHRRALDSLQTLLNARPSRRIPCTSFNDLLRRASRQSPKGRVDIALTDGLNSCGPSLIGPIPPSGNRLIIVLVTPATFPERSRARSFDVRRRALLRLVPWAEIVPIWELEAALEHRATPVRATTSER